MNRVRPQSMISTMTRTLTEKVIAFLKQGLTPHDLALTVAIGVTMGIFPVLGMTTILCTLAAVTLRLNLPALQSVNWAMSPVQLLLLIPFTHAGAWVFGGTGITLSLAEVKILMETDLLGTIAQFLTAVLRGIGLWALIAVPIGVVLYMVSLPFLTRAARLVNVAKQQRI